MNRLISLLITAACYFPGAIQAQYLDTAAINGEYQRAHRIHEDSTDVAIELCFDVLKKSQAINYLKGQGDAYLTLGAISRLNNRLTESYRYFYHALKIRQEIGDSNRVTAVYTNIAFNKLEESKYDSAIALILYAIKITEALPQPDYTVLGSEYLLLSNLCAEYLEPEDAMRYAKRSLAAYIRTNNSELTGKAAYALGNRFLAQGVPDSALLYYDQAYNNILASSQSLDMLANILTNKGIIYTRRYDFARADQFFNEAKTALDRSEDYADYFYLFLNMGERLVKENKWPEALVMLKKALPEDASELSFLDQQYLFENMAITYNALHILDSAYYYQKRASLASDSIFNERKQKLFTRFQAERYKTESITQQANAQKQSFRARIFFISSSLLLLLLAMIIYAYVQRKRAFLLINRQQEELHQQQVDELIKNSELSYLSAGLEGREAEREQIARELHDRLGSAIVTLIWQYDAILENTSTKSGNHQPMIKLNESLQHLYQDIRSLGHQLGSGVLQRAGLVPVLTELCHNIESGKRMEVSFSHFGLDNRLDFFCEVNMLRIIQELISNILKYAQASQLSLQINRIDDNVNIMVEDNGRGFDPRTGLISTTGAGLNNIESRLRSLNGTIQFETRPEGGTTVILNIPIPKSDTNYEPSH